MFQLGDLSNPELRILTDQLDKIKYGGKYIYNIERDTLRYYCIK